MFSALSSYKASPETSTFFTVKLKYPYSHMRIVHIRQSSSPHRLNVDGPKEENSGDAARFRSWSRVRVTPPSPVPPTPAPSGEI